MHRHPHDPHLARLARRAALLLTLGAGCGPSGDARPGSESAGGAPATGDARAAGGSPRAPAAPSVTCAGEGVARTCAVVGLFDDAPDARLTLATGENVPDTLVVTLQRAGREPVRLPTFYGSRLWGQCAPTTDDRDLPRLDRLAVTDVDGDGHRDVVVLAQCMTGMGRTGATPFPAGAVYLGDARGGYRAEEPVDSAFTDLANPACSDGEGGARPCDVRALAREAVRRGRAGG
jgi:hypothetical protein